MGGFRLEASIFFILSPAFSGLESSPPKVCSRGGDVRSGSCGTILLDGFASCNLRNSSSLALSYCLFMTLLPPETLRSRSGSLDLERWRNPNDVLRPGVLGSEGDSKGKGDAEGGGDDISSKEEIV